MRAWWPPIFTALGAIALSLAVTLALHIDWIAGLLVSVAIGVLMGFVGWGLSE